MTQRERRRTSRRTPDASESLARVRLRGGRDVAVIDLSPAGALVEGEARLLPGTHIDVHVLTSRGRVLVRSRVVRAEVSDLSRERIAYRSGLAFERHVDVGAGYSIPASLSHPEPPSGIVYPHAHL